MARVTDDLHIAICQAVASLNQGDEPRIAHGILRQALVDYADASPPEREAEQEGEQTASCVCHQGSVCTPGCERFHHVGCPTAFPAKTGQEGDWAEELLQIADWLDPSKDPMPKDVSWAQLADRIRNIATTPKPSPAHTAELDVGNVCLPRVICSLPIQFIFALRATGNLLRTHGPTSPAYFSLVRQQGDGYAKGLNDAAAECDRYLEQLKGRNDARADGAFVAITRLVKSIRSLPPAPGEKGKAMTDIENLVKLAAELKAVADANNDTFRLRIDVLSINAEKVRFALECTETADGHPFVSTAATSLDVAVDKARLQIPGACKEWVYENPLTAAATEKGDK